MASLSLVSETTRTSTTTNNVLFIGLNQDHGCFACGTDNGFIIFNSEPLKERFRRGTRASPPHSLMLTTSIYICIYVCGWAGFTTMLCSLAVRF